MPGEGIEEIQNQVRRLKSSENPDEKLEIIQSLGRYNDQTAVFALLEELNGPDVFISSRVESVLLENSKTILRHLLSGLRSRSEAIRRNASYILGEIASYDTVEPLIRNLLSNYPSVKEESAKALSTIVHKFTNRLRGESERVIKPFKRALMTPTLRSDDTVKSLFSEISQCIGDISRDLGTLEVAPTGETPPTTAERAAPGSGRGTEGSALPRELDHQGAVDRLVESIARKEAAAAEEKPAPQEEAEVEGIATPPEGLEFATMSDSEFADKIMDLINSFSLPAPETEEVEKASETAVEGSKEGPEIGAEDIADLVAKLGSVEGASGEGGVGVKVGLEGLDDLMKDLQTEREKLDRIPAEQVIPAEGFFTPPGEEKKSEEEAPQERIFESHQEMISSINETLEDFSLLMKSMGNLDDTIESMRGVAAAMEDTLNSLSIWKKKKEMRPIIRALKSQYPRVRLEAIGIIEELKDVRGFEGLMDAMHDASIDVRKRAVNAVASFIEGEIKDKIPKVIGAYETNIEALGAMKGLEIARRRLLAASREGNERLKKAAGESRLKFVRTLVNILNSELEREVLLPRIKIDAIARAAENGAGAVLEPILIHFAHHRDERIRATAAKNLGVASKSKRALKTLVDLLDGDPDNRVRANAVEALELMKIFFLREKIAGLLKDPNNRIRANAAKMLYTMGDPRGIETLLAMLKSDDEWMRASAVWGLSKTGDPRAREALLEAGRTEKKTSIKEMIYRATSSA